MRWISWMAALPLMLGAADFSALDGTVVDNAAQLEWQDENGSLQSRASWGHAVKYCEDLELFGLDDWRLPTQAELEGIVDRKRRMPAIDAAFRFAKPDFYWTSTVNPEDEHQAYAIHFSFGSGGFDYKYDEYKVRCVRTTEE